MGMMRVSERGKMKATERIKEVQEMIVELTAKLEQYEKKINIHLEEKNLILAQALDRRADMVFKEIGLYQRELVKLQNQQNWEVVDG